MNITYHLRPISIILGLMLTNTQVFAKSKNSVEEEMAATYYFCITPEVFKSCKKLNQAKAKTYSRYVSNWNSLYRLALKNMKEAEAEKFENTCRKFQRAFVDSFHEETKESMANLCGEYEDGVSHVLKKKYFGDFIKSVK